jgi:hypothetical protein
MVIYVVNEMRNRGVRVWKDHGYREWTCAELYIKKHSLHRG